MAIKVEDDDGNEVTLPVRFDVCPECEGHGTKCKLGAMSGSKFREYCDDDPDFGEDYKRGVYDGPCPECKGLRVVEVVDEEACDPKLYATYLQDLQDEADQRAIERQEYLYCGGWREEGWYGHD